MQTRRQATGIWPRLPTSVRAILAGLLVGMIAANVWPLLVLKLPVAVAVVAELAFLVVYLWWARGGGPPTSTSPARGRAFRARTVRFTAKEWIWGLTAAVAFAVTVHAAIVILFRLTPFPAAAFHHGYDFSFAPDPAMRWLAVVVSALSAGVCEETGFRGYMQEPIERTHGAPGAIVISAVLFTLIHLNKDWATVGMTPIVLMAGLLLGALAWASRSLLFCIIGHTIMDIGLFAYWWTQTAGVFDGKPISQTGVDTGFLLALAVFALALATTAVALMRLRGGAAAT